MISHGNPPFLECSSKGDKRFSAFYAKLNKFNGKSIEELYQGAKVLSDGRGPGLTWKEAKGHKAVNQEELRIMYSELWDLYIKENPELIEVLLSSSGLSDIFGQHGHVCQATELWRIRNNYNKSIK